MLPTGSIVIVHLVSPTEKIWGVLGEINVAGVSVRAINLSSFDDWMGEAARGEELALGLSTMFVPMHRVERLFLDEPVGEVESYSQRFARRVGKPVEAYLGIESAPAGGSMLPS